MPDIRLDDELTMHYEEDDFTDPWASSEVVVFLHGLAESGAIWYGWMPAFARRFRVLRPDLRGFGQSTVPMRPLDFPWSPQGWADDIDRFLHALDVDSAHVVAVRVGTAAALQLAARHPGRVRTLTLVSGLARGGDLRGLDPVGGGPRIAVADAPQTIARIGLRAYLEQTNGARLGSDAPPALIQWSVELQARSSEEVVRGVLTAARGIDLTEILPRVQAPTLVLAASDSVVQTIEATRGWQSLIPQSELQPMPGDSPHLALLHPEECAARSLAFIDRLRPTSS